MPMVLATWHAGILQDIKDGDIINITEWNHDDPLCSPEESLLNFYAGLKSGEAWSINGADWYFEKQANPIYEQPYLIPTYPIEDAVYFTNYRWSNPIAEKEKRRLSMSISAFKACIESGSIRKVKE